MAISDTIYIYEIEGISVLFGEYGIDNKAKYNYDKLRLWTFDSDKFTLNFLTARDRSTDVIYQFGKCDELTDFLIEKGVEPERYSVLSWEKTKGFIKDPVLQLNNDLELKIEGGRWAIASLEDERAQKNRIVISSFKDAYEQDPFRKFRVNPILKGEASLSDDAAVESLLQNYKKQKRSDMGWGILGCFGGSLLWLIGTLIVVAIVIYLVAQAFA